MSKRLFVFLAIAGWFAAPSSALAIQPSVNAIELEFLSAAQPDPTPGAPTIVVGYEVTPRYNIAVDRFGLYDHDGDGLTTAGTFFIYRAFDEALLDMEFIFADAQAEPDVEQPPEPPLEDRFRYVINRSGAPPVPTPLLLQRGVTYIIAVELGLNSSGARNPLVSVDPTEFQHPALIIGNGRRVINPALGSEIPTEIVPKAGRGSGGQGNRRINSHRSSFRMVAYAAGPSGFVP